MRINRYNKFLEKRNNTGMEMINEDLARARKLLKDRYIINSVAKDLDLIQGDLKYKMDDGLVKTYDIKEVPADKREEFKKAIREFKITDPNVIARLEKDEDFLDIREMLKSRIGYLYMFTYFYFIENIPFNELEYAYDDIVDNLDLIDRFKIMPTVRNRKFDAMSFIDVNIPNKSEHRSNFEILTDGLLELYNYRKIKKVIDELPNKFRQEFRTASPKVMNELLQLATAFDEIKDPDSTEDKKGNPHRLDIDGNKLTKKEAIWKGFFGDMVIDTRPMRLDGTVNPNFNKPVFRSALGTYLSDNQNLSTIVKAGLNYIDSVSTSDFYGDIIKKIERINHTFGIMGIKVTYNFNKIIVVDVKSYAANKELNGGLVRQCIVDGQSSWDNYVKTYNLQYYVYDTNLRPSDKKAVVGITVEADGSIVSAYDKENDFVNAKKFLAEIEKRYNLEDKLIDYIYPMSPEEQERKRKAIEAERILIEPGITLDKLKECVLEYGADINKSTGAALTNAVIEDDYEKVKWCLEVGANPNLRESSNAPISRTSNLEMIKLLIKYNANMTTSVYMNIRQDYNAIEVLLDAGLSPNFSRSMPFRNACKGTFTDTDKGEAFMDILKLLLKPKYRAYLLDPTRPPEEQRNSALIYAADYGRVEALEYLYETRSSECRERDWLRVLEWLTHSKRSSVLENSEVIIYTYNRIKNKNLIPDSIKKILMFKELNLK